MQDHNQNKSDFLERTDALAVKLDVPLRQLGEKIGLSTAMLFACRAGTQVISKKTWSKLERAEASAIGGVAEAPPLVSRRMEDYLAFIRTCREEAEALGKGDRDATTRIFDTLLATWCMGIAQAQSERRPISDESRAAYEELMRRADEAAADRKRGEASAKYPNPGRRREAS